MLIGLMSLYSIDRGGNSRYFVSQAIRIVIGLIPAAVLFLIPPSTLHRKSWLLYAVSLACLIAVFAMGFSSKGAQRWIDLGPFDFQPSELAKLLLALTLSAYYANRQDSIDSIWTYVLSMAHVGGPLLLVLMQPHLGGAVTLLVIWLGISLIAGVPWKYLLGTVVATAALLWGAYASGMLKPYQLQRIESFVKGGGDNDNRYHQVRALIAFGSGGVWGQGYLKGENRGTGFVPEQQTDYISTVIGEEGGLVGSALLVGAFGFFFYRLWLIMFRAIEPFNKLVIAGIFSYLAFHMIANLGMNLEMLPVVGLWLPFLSVGGTAIWLCMGSVALALNISSRERPD